MALVIPKFDNNYDAKLLDWKVKILKENIKTMAKIVRGEIKDKDYFTEQYEMNFIQTAVAV